MEKDTVEIIPNAALEAAKQARQAQLDSFELRRIARTLIVPPDDDDVRKALRSRQQPVCLFGEDAYDRRERLRALMARHHLARRKHGDGHLQQAASELADQTVRTVEQKEEEEKEEEEKEEEEEEFYTEGDASLKSLRRRIAIVSLHNARLRLNHEDVRERCGTTVYEEAREKEAAVVTNSQKLSILASHVGDERPLSAITAAYPHDGATAFVATGSWSGRVCIWDGDVSGTLLQSLQLHEERISNLHVSPAHPDLLLTCAADGHAHVLRRRRRRRHDDNDDNDDNDDDNDGLFKVVHRLDSPHEGCRVGDAKIHPHIPAVVATCGYDGSVVIHDDGKQSLRQPTGHSRVHRVAFHPDGSLLASAGLEGGVRVWDLRSGRAVMTMRDAHTDGTLDVQFDMRGSTMASCGMDGMLRVWDLRKMRCAKTIAAHRGVVCAIRFAGGVDKDDLLYSAGFDGCVKCWAARRDWSLVMAHTGLQDKATALDCRPDAARVVVACYDKTWKTWGSDDAD